MTFAVPLVSANTTQRFRITETRALLVASTLAVLASALPAQSILWRHNLPGEGGDLRVTEDLDGDGLRDVVVTGSLGPYGWAETRSTRTGQVLLAFRKPSPSLVLAMDTGADVDGDGCADVVISTREYSSNNSSQVHVYCGTSGRHLVTVNPPVPDPAFGQALALLGDTDGDGDGEYAVGVHGPDTTHDGAIYFYSGLDAAPYRTLRGTPMDRGPGQSLRRIADIDGDRVADLLASNHSPRGVRLISSATGEEIHRFPFPFGWTFEWHLADAEDLDGDGVGDYFVGSRKFEAGRAAAVSGATGQRIWFRTGETTGDGFGSCIERVHDMDGDGVRDIAIGSSTSFSLRGQIHVFSSASGEELFRAEGETWEWGFGDSVASFGDISGDGRPDLMVHSWGSRLAMISSQCDRPRTVCRGGLHSQQVVAELRASGSLSLGDNAFRLDVHQAPGDTIGLFVYGRFQQAKSFGGGTLCVNGPNGVLPFPYPIQTSAIGAASWNLDFQAPPFDLAPGRIRPLRHTYFQFLYRDPQSTGEPYNSSNSLRVTFCP